MTAGAFPWPCHRRDAHGPHERRQAGTMPARIPVPQLGVHYAPGEVPTVPGDDVVPVYDAGGGHVTRDPECPGVAAHPATMAGGNYPTERP